MNPLDSTNKILLLDNSAIEVLTTCPRKCQYQLLLQRRRSGRSPALRFGQHIHSALAYRFRCQALGLPWKEETQMRILDRRFTSDPCEEEEWRNLGAAQKLVAAYNLNWASDQLEVVRHHGFPMVEKPFAVLAGEIAGWRIFYTGRIDLAYRAGTALRVMDHKTTSVLAESYWTDAAMSGQGRGYCWALQRVLQQKVTGYTINALGCRAPTRTGVPIEFARRDFYTNGTLEEWHNNMLAIAEGFLWHLSKDRWPMHTKHCMGKYGACEFLAVCSLPASQRLELLQSTQYQENTWTPLYT